MTTATTEDGKTQVDPKLDESQGKSGDDETIPKRQFLAALKSATEKTEAAQRDAAEAKAMVAELTKKQEQKPPTRAELLKFVEAGDLTQEAADAIWEKQMVERAKREAAAETSRTLGANAHQQRVEAELAGYRELKAEAWDEGTPERARVEKEFKHLVQVVGMPATRETEAVALRAAFGDLPTLRAAQSVRSGPSDTHEETGGGKPAGGGGKSDAPKLSAEQKRYYEKGIESGRYKDWAAVGEELKYAKKR